MIMVVATARTMGHDRHRLRSRLPALRRSPSRSLISAFSNRKSTTLSSYSGAQKLRHRRRPALDMFDEALAVFGAILLRPPA